MQRFARLSFVVVFVPMFSLVRADDEDSPDQTPAARLQRERDREVEKLMDLFTALMAKADREALDKEFAKSLVGVTLVGYFTTNGLEDKGLKEEKYKLQSVKKLPDANLWLIEYQYGEKGAVIRLPLEVQWAGDTPVITLTEAVIPGVGTFTARILFYRGDYAGTWRAGDHRGKLFGKIVKENNEDKVE
jgi:hypothetical protein